jgi:hypothetical protein
MLDEVTAAVARGAILRTLRLWLYKDRPAGDTRMMSYMSEVLIQAHLSRFENLTLPEGELRGLLTYLKDAGYVKYEEERIGHETYLRWRILDTGIQLLEGHLQDAGIRRS